LISSSIPKKGHPLNVTFREFTDDLVEKQKNLKILIFKYLFKAFQDRPQTSYITIIQEAINPLVDQANEKTTGSEFFVAFLKEFLEELSDSLEPKIEENHLFSQITLLRAAHLASNPEERNKVNDALHHCLHTHMMAKEKARLIDNLRDKVINLYPKVQ
ncbi:MAG TPA: hypothetical protein VIH61_04975, partial [Waddliaceae bacterium]